VHGEQSVEPSVALLFPVAEMGVIARPGHQETLHEFLGVQGADRRGRLRPHDPVHGGSDAGLQDAHGTPIVLDEAIEDGVGHGGGEVIEVIGQPVLLMVVFDGLGFTRGPGSQVLMVVAGETVPGIPARVQALWPVEAFVLEEIPDSASKGLVHRNSYVVSVPFFLTHWWITYQNRPSDVNNVA
jgi:hypothetical protein